MIDNQQNQPSEQEDLQTQVSATNNAEQNNAEITDFTSEPLIPMGDGKTAYRKYRHLTFE